MNKRHYEHTLPNIRGSLSNTYDEIISEVDYEFKNYGDYEIDTEICGKNDEGGL